MTDDILQEVRAVREAYAASLGFDLDAIVADLQRRERDHGRALVRTSPRPAVPQRHLA